MGALEFYPLLGPKANQAEQIEIGELVTLGSEILTQRQPFQADFTSSAREQSMQDILKVGTSTGGARAKAIIAWHPDQRGALWTSGRETGFQYWLSKFDGSRANRDKELDDPAGYGAKKQPEFSEKAKTQALPMLPPNRCC